MRFTVFSTSLLDEVSGSVRLALGVLGAAVALLLMLTCANVANLVLTRADSRSREVAVRTALGAGIGDILRLSLTESMMLGLAGGGLGLGFAWAGVRLLVMRAPTSIPRVSELALDWRVVLFTTPLSMGTGVLFGLAPLTRLSRLRPFERAARWTGPVGRIRASPGTHAPRGGRDGVRRSPADLRWADDPLVRQSFAHRRGIRRQQRDDDAIVAGGVEVCEHREREPLLHQPGRRGAPDTRRPPRGFRAPAAARGRHRRLRASHQREAYPAERARAVSRLAGRESRILRGDEDPACKGPILRHGATATPASP